MKVAEWFVAVCGFILLSFFTGFTVYAGLETIALEAKGDPIGLTCGVVTPSGIQPTFSAEKVKGIRVSDFGVIHSRDFIYTPASGEVCVFIYKED